MTAKQSRATTKKLSLPEHASYSQISTFQRCKTQYYWRYLLGIERTERFAGLFRGLMLHRAYDAYMFHDREAHSIAFDVVDRLAQEALDQGDGDTEMINAVADEARECLENYLPWADENDNWTLVVPEGANECEVTGQIPIELPDGTTKPFMFKLDALVMHEDRLLLLENKFRKNLDSSGLEHDLQILLYQAAWNLLNPDHPIEGVIYNIVAAKPRKKDGAVGTRELFYRGAVEEQVAMNMLRAVMMEQRMQLKLGLWPMNPRKECSWDCDFVGMCLGVRAGAKVDEYITTGAYRYRLPHA